MWDVVERLAGAWALVSAGVFLSFSTFVMAGLGRLGADEGVHAMRQVNLAAPRSALFMATLFGPGVLSLAVAVHALLVWQGERSVLELAGATAYVLGVVVVTVAYHVPRNVRLEAMDDEAAHREWRLWARRWTGANHVRTLSALVGGVLMLLGSR
ncbi:anthrone oxygenase family protein [Nocardioides aurantiacus]|uniref:anthrone oxygenase family protein n=1 Tax=Nocardioides aurantiacus TaxID=86796 RepID=UPI00403F776A